MGEMDEEKEYSVSELEEKESSEHAEASSKSTSSNTRGRERAFRGKDGCRDEDEHGRDRFKSPAIGF